MRLFVGIWPPEPVIGVLCDAQRRLAQRAPSGAVRLTRRDQLHLTLCFLGEVDEGRVEGLVAVLRLGVATLDRLSLAVEGLGVFPEQGAPRVIWAGLRGDMDALRVVQALVVRWLGPFAQAEDRKPFHPHITLARAQGGGRPRVGRWRDRGVDERGRQEDAHGEPRSLAAVVRALTIRATDPWPVVAVRLMRSDLGPDGARYEQVAECPFRVPGSVGEG